MRRLHPQEFVRQCSVVKRHEYGPEEVFWRMTKELTASAPSAMKIKVVAPTDNVILTVGVKRLPLLGSVVPTKVQRAPGR